MWGECVGVSACLCHSIFLCACQLYKQWWRPLPWEQPVSLTGIAGHQQIACMFPCVSEYVCVSLCKTGRRNGGNMHERGRERESENRKRGCKMRTKTWGTEITCRQILEREKMDKSPLRACSTCLQHRQRSGEEDQSSSDSDFKMLKIFFYSIPTLWEFKGRIYFCCVPLICPARFMTPRPRMGPIYMSNYQKACLHFPTLIRNIIWHILTTPILI